MESASYFYLVAFLIGVVAGLRAMIPLTAVSLAAAMDWLHLENTPLAFFASAYTPYIFIALAIIELVNDKFPKTPSRKLPAPFAIRVAVGAVAGSALGAGRGLMAAGAIAGAIGGVAGTLGGYEFRRRLAKETGKDIPIALLEDAIAIGLACWVVLR